MATDAALAAQPSEPPRGRFAETAASCKLKDYFVTLTDGSIILPAFSCKGVDYGKPIAQAGETGYAVTAAACVDEESNTPHEEKFKLVLDKRSLVIFWSDGSKSAKFTRCPE
jgi:hypothetical protein